MAALTKKEIAELIVDFLNENGMWNEFETFLDEKGYKPEELGIEEDV